MGELLIENTIIQYAEAGKTRVLLDFADHLSNKSKIPLHSPTDDLTVMSLIKMLLQRYPQISKGTEEAENIMESIMINTLLAAFLVKTSLPVKVLEIGCTNGIMSYSLATILGSFHKRSELCCMSDVIGNTSQNQWLDKMALVSDVPELSLVIADYEKTPLASDYFDIVIINGSVYFQEPFQVIKEAKRLTKKNGLLLCYCCNAPLLESSFCFHFQNREEYYVKNNVKIMTVKILKKEDEGQGYQNWIYKVQMCLEKAEQKLKEQPEPQEIGPIIEEIDGYIDQAIEREELDKKVQLIHMKEALLDEVVRYSFSGHRG